MRRNGGSRPSRGWRPNICRPSYGMRPSYNDLRLRQRNKGRDPGRARWRKNKFKTRTTRATVMRGRRITERRSMDPTRTRSETTTSSMETKMLIGMPSRAVAILRQINGREAEAMETTMKSCFRRRIWKR